MIIKYYNFTTAIIEPHRRWSRLDLLPATDALHRSLAFNSISLNKSPQDPFSDDFTRYVIIKLHISTKCASPQANAIKKTPPPAPFKFNITLVSLSWITIGPRTRRYRREIWSMRWTRKLHFQIYDTVSCWIDGHRWDDEKTSTEKRTRLWEVRAFKLKNHRLNTRRSPPTLTVSIKNQLACQQRWVGLDATRRCNHAQFSHIFRFGCSFPIYLFANSHHRCLVSYKAASLVWTSSRASGTPFSLDRQTGGQAGCRQSQQHWMWESTTASIVSTCWCWLPKDLTLSIRLHWIHLYPYLCCCCLYLYFLFTSCMESMLLLFWMHLEWNIHSLLDCSFLLFSGQ